MATSNPYYNSRPLGKIETFFHSLTKIGLYNNFASSIVLTPRLEMKTHKSLIAFVVREILTENPLLLCNVFDKSIKVVDKVEFDDLIEMWDVEDEQMDSAMTKINKIRFQYGDMGKLLFKIVIINQESFYFVFDHSIFDGLSSINFLKLFVNKLNTITPSSSFDQLLFEKESTTDYIIPPPADEMIDQLSPPDPPRQPSLPDLPVWRSKMLYINNEHKFQVITLSPDDSSKIKKICHFHGVTITPYLQHCFVVTKSRILNNSSSFIEEVSFGANSRTYIDPNFQNENIKFGCIVTGLFAMIASSQNIDWDLVVADGLYLKQLLVSGSILRRAGKNVIMSTRDWDEVHYERSILSGSKTRGTLMFSNLGFQDFEQSPNDAFQVVQSFFIQSSCNQDFIFSSNVISDQNGMTIVNSMVNNDEINEDQFQMLNKEFREIILNPDNTQN